MIFVDGLWDTTILKNEIMKKEKNDPTTAFMMFGWGGVLITLIVILLIEYLNLL